MSQKINIKSIIIIFLAMIIGVYVMFIQDQIITGLIIIAGGISLNFLEVVKWIKDIHKFIKSFNKEEDEPEKEKSTSKPSVHHETNIKFGDNAKFSGDVAMGESKIDKK